jgi:ATP-binding cassette subfamily C protein CydC
MITSLGPFLNRHKGLTLLALFASVCTLLAGIGLMSSSGYLISRAAERPPILDLMLIIVAVRFFALSRAAFRYLERLVSHDLTFRWLMDVRVRLYRALAPRIPTLLLRNPSGDLLTRLGQDVDTLQNLYLRVWAPVIAASMVVSLTVLGLALFSSWLAVVALVFLMLNAILLPTIAVRQSRGIGSQQVLARSALSADIVETLQGLGDLLMLNQDSAAKAKIDRRDRQLADAQRRQARVTSLQDAATLLCAHIGMTAVLIVAIPLVGSGQIAGIFLALLTLGVLTSFEAVQSLGVAFQFHEQTKAATRRIAEIEKTPLLVADTETIQPPASVDIRVNDLHFAYEDRPTLAGISMTLPQGKRLGLIGPSGTGKSTLAALLLRFLDPDAGHIKIGGIDLRQLDAADVRRLFAVVPQQVYLFNQSLRDNLLLARPDADEESIWQALEQAQLAAWVRSLPNGLDTWLAEHGVNVSGGERQRLAIARALLKQAPIWILDEPTAHLDNHTEQEVVQTLLTVSAGKSVLWITHRLTGLDQLDELYVMTDGQIREQGTHEELIAHNDYYARMLRLQHQTLTTAGNSSS